MRILVFTNLFPNPRAPHHGVFIRQRVSTYVQAGHAVHVVVPVAWFPFLELLRPRFNFGGAALESDVEGLRVTYVKYLNVPGAGMHIQPFLMALSVLPVASRLHRAARFDLVDGHYLYPDGVVAARIARRLGIPCVLSARGSDVNVLLGFPRVRAMVLGAIARSSAVVAVSAALRNRLVDAGVPASAIEVVPNGVDPQRFSHDPELTAARAAPGRRKRVLMVGYLRELKGQHLLVEALRLLSPARCPFAIDAFFIGSPDPSDPAYPKRLRESSSSVPAPHTVTLVGPVPHRELRRWYNEADVLCVLSRAEGCPNVLLEAGVCGLPVVATDVGDVGDLVEPGRTGIVVEGRDAEAVAAALLRALGATWDRESIARRSSRFTWDSVRDRVLDVFERVTRPATERRPA